MSGPKLSEYELEQLRKAELERIQREIENLHANILRIKKDIFSILNLSAVAIPRAQSPSLFPLTA